VSFSFLVDSDVDMEVDMEVEDPLPDIRTQIYEIWDTISHIQSNYQYRLLLQTYRYIIETFPIKPIQ